MIRKGQNNVLWALSRFLFLFLFHLWPLNLLRFRAFFHLQLTSPTTHCLYLIQQWPKSSLVFDTVTSHLVILPHFGMFFACSFANSCFVTMSFLPEVEGYADEKGPKQCPSGSRWVLFSFFFFLSVFLILINVLLFT